MDESPVIKLEKINKTFPGVRALNDINFSLKKGEIHSIVGENGAGKSTLINIIIGVLNQDRGDIYINGKKQEHYSPSIARELGLGIVPQELNLFPDRSVAENIMLGVSKKKTKFPYISWSQIYKDARDVLKNIDSKINVRTKVSDFTIAYQQLVQIARAIAFGANILILDEPTASLTMHETENLFRLIENFKKEDKSIIFISHHLEEVKKISDRISVMRDGELITTMDNKDIDIEKIIKLMAGKKIKKVSNDRSDKKIKKECVLEIKDLTRINEFNKISFKVKKGEILGIAGLVGSGRTELAKCIFGETQPSSGKVLWFGKETRIISPNNAIEIGIGYVPEDRRNEGMFPLLSITENILMPLLQSMARFFGINNRKKENIANQYVEDLNIKTPSTKQQIKFLSGGNQQKVILARWLAKNVKLLILDEPTRGIDVNAKGEIHRLINELANNELAVIVISSELEEVINLSHRILVMHEGNLKGFLDAGNIVEEDILKVALGNN